jgi:hypothetical protein
LLNKSHNFNFLAEPKLTQREILAFPNTNNPLRANQRGGSVRWEFRRFATPKAKRSGHANCCCAKPLSEAFFCHLLFDKIKAKNRQGNLHGHFLLAL